ncbi:3-oxoacyl-[acyl-carrier protein] reductase [Nitrospirillum viridazoti]|uniref:3-oxoacyl-[acyl-carrier protein] reductase n=1 Tax=Nitrospirillum amazonense TaxID=28077 RepID=A0A560HMW3_9PROT|nr:3-oxoacyl-[acyl-carrier protein] reductase [Nitrospirillum amazonense]
MQRAGRLANRTAVVTGAASGLGRAVAVALAQEGANVILHHLLPDEQAAATETARQVQALGRTGIVVQADITQPAGAYTVAEAAIAAFDHVDILVNNAGFRLKQPFDGMTLELFEATMAANMGGTFLMVRHLLPLMRARSYGRIVTTVDSTAMEGARGMTAYGAAASALLGFTRSLVHEFGDNDITANCVCPGHLPPDADGEEEDWAGITPAYVFLASDDAYAMIGQTLRPSP